MALKREGKNKICRKYWDILNFIYVAGNKVIYKTLLEEVCLKYGLVESKTQFKRIIEELLWADLIKIQRCKEGEALILKKGALIPLEFMENSQQVAAVPSASIDNRLRLSTIKIKYMLSGHIMLKDNIYSTIFSYYTDLLFFDKNDYVSMGAALREVLSQFNVYNNNKDGLKIKFLTNIEEVSKETARLSKNAKILRNKLNKGENESIITLEDEYMGGIDYQTANNCYCIYTGYREAKNQFSEFYDCSLHFCIFLYRDKISEEKIGEIIAYTYEYYKQLCWMTENGNRQSLNFKFTLVSSNTNVERLFRASNRPIYNVIEKALATKIGPTQEWLIDTKTLKIDYLII